MVSGAASFPRGALIDKLELHLVRQAARLQQLSSRLQGRF